LEICGFTSSGKLGMVTEKHGVGADCVVGFVSVAEAGNFFGAAFGPSGGLFTCVEMAILLNFAGDWVEKGVEGCFQLSWMLVSFL